MDLPNQTPDQPMLPFEMQTIPDEAQNRRGWDLAMNGESVTEVTSMQLHNDRMGVTVEYGQRPEGYDGFIIREPGGAATMPYVIDAEGGIYVGMVEESRPTMGEATTHNIPRGFSDFGESKEQTAVRELGEETGYQALGSRLIKLAGGLNPNSTFFDYSRSRDAGVDMFALPVETHELEVRHNDKGDVYYAFPQAVQDQAEGDKSAERILGSRFVPITEAMRSRDMFTAAAAGHLVVHLLQQGEYLLPQSQIASELSGAR